MQLSIAQNIPIDGALIVTTPQTIALLDARRGIEMFRKMEVPILGIVENMAEHVCEKCGHTTHIFGREGAKNLAAEQSVPVVGKCLQATAAPSNLGLLASSYAHRVHGVLEQ